MERRSSAPGAPGGRGDDRKRRVARETCNAGPYLPPLSALTPGAEHYNGLPRAGYIVTPGPGYGPEQSYGYPSAQIYRPARVVRPRHALRHHRAMKRRVVEYRR